MKHDRFVRTYTALVLSIVMLMSLTVSAIAIEAEEDPTVSVTVDGEDVELKDANGSELDPVMIDGSTYLPVRAIAEALGLGVHWDRATREVQLTAPGGTAAPSAATKAAVPAVVHLDGTNGKFGFGEGYIMGYEDNGIYTFKNIPYGEHERFMRAAPVKKYGTQTAPLVALNNGPVSPQQNTLTEYVNWAAAAAFMTPSDSDMFSTEAACLNLNVWTDSLNTSAKKPVLVFMHGGGTENGSAIELKMYDGSYFADYTDVVFVSVNARLNYLGYLDLTSIGGGANQGLSDMVLSLEWVKDNIARFGGDPDNVTIMGQSGGGTKVSSLASSPKALREDLFQKVVIASGFGSRALPAAQWTENAAKLADAARASSDLINYIRVNGAELGLSVSDSTTMAQLTELAADASDEIVFKYLQQLEYSVLYDLCGDNDIDTGMTADGEYYDASGSLTADGLNETARHYTYLIGSNWAEMGGGNSADAVLGTNWDGTGAPQSAVSSLTTAQKNERMEAWRKTTIRNAEGERVPATRPGSLEEIRAAFTAAYPGHDLYDLHSLGSLDLNNETYKGMAGLVEDGNSVYHYYVTYTMPYFGGMTMIHTADLAYFFHSISTSSYMIHGDEANAWKVADAMASSLAAFCASGDPSIPGFQVQPVTADQDHIILYDINNRCVTPDFNAQLQELATPVAD